MTDITCLRGEIIANNFDYTVMKDVIIVPTYNEKENIVKLVPLIFKNVPDIYVCVADDNSPDGTADAVNKLKINWQNLSLISRSKKDGLGRAYINAFSKVLEDKDVRSVIMMDADMSHSPEYLKEMLAKSRDYSVVVGSRYVKGGATVGWELWRRVLSSLGNFYCRTITRLPTHDCTGGFNVISAELLRKIDFSKMDMSGYAFIMELKYMLYKAGASFYEVPIIFKNRALGETKISSHIISEGVWAPIKMILKRKEIAESIKNPVCPMCQSDKVYFYCEKRKYKLYKCNSCKLLYIYPVPESLSVYDTAYFSGAKKGFGYIDYDADKKPMISIFEKYLDIFKEQGFSGGRLLDVGCATGFFMEIAKKRGFQVCGVEVSEFAAEKGRMNSLNIITGDIFTPKYPDNYFDVVTMFDVIEHVPDPKVALLEAKRILKNGGLLVVNTPDSESVWAKAWGSRWQLIVPPEHIHYFSPQSLSTYLKKNGFLVTLDTKIGKKFTIQYIFKMIYQWTRMKVFLTSFFSNTLFSKLYIPINLRDNFFMILKKQNNK